MTGVMNAERDRITTSTCLTSQKYSTNVITVQKMERYKMDPMACELKIKLE